MGPGEETPAGTGRSWQFFVRRKFWPIESRQALRECVPSVVLSFGERVGGPGGGQTLTGGRGPGRRAKFDVDVQYLTF